MPNVSVPYQFVPNTDILASEANANFQALVNAVNGNIGSDNLQNTAVTTSKIASGAVTGAKIANNTISGAKLMDGGLTPSKWETSPGYSVLGRASSGNGGIGYVTAAGNNVVLGRGATGDLTFLKVTADMIDGNAVGASSLGVGAVHEQHIAGGAVTNAKLASGGFDAGKITTGTLPPSVVPNLSANKITSDVLAVARVPNLDASKITSGVLNVSRIPDMSASKITSGQFGTARIADGAVNGDKLAGTLVGNRTFAGTVSFTSPIQLPLL